MRRSTMDKQEEAWRANLAGTPVKGIQGHEEASSPLRLPYPPSANHFKVAVKGRMVLTQEARDYKEQAGWIAKSWGITALECPVRLFVNVYRPRRQGDLDNSLKLILDTLTGIAYLDDSQVVEIHAKRFDDPSDPRVEITIEEAGSVARLL
jgi:crossover junction endodeoxyribonuclease RusA